MDSLVLAIDGEASGQPWRAGWAVYYGPDSPHNSSGVVSHPLPQSASFAKIQALKYALISVRNLLSCGNTFSSIHIKTVSPYLAKMMTGALRTCALNGWRDQDGFYLEHVESWEWINHLLCDLERVHGWQTEFCIEHVRSGFSVGASRLACKAIEDCIAAEETGDGGNSV